MGIDARQRPEDLTVQDWVRLARALTDQARAHNSEITR
jgi:hypothetical protein